MNPMRKFRCTIGLLAFMLAGAACALAQAEINPDHFDDAPQQTPAVKRAALTPGTPHAIPGTTTSQNVKQQTASRAGTAAQGSAHASARATTAGSVPPGKSSVLPQSDSDQLKKKLVSEVRRHDTP